MNGLTPIPPPARGPHCPAPAVLEALSASEQASDQVTRHVASCADCQGYVTALQAEQRVYDQMRSPQQFLQKLERRAEAESQQKRARPWLAWFGGLAAAGLAIAVLAPAAFSDHSHLPVTSGVITKGGGLNVVYRRGEKGSPQPVAADARLRKGDALRFAYDSDVAGHLLILDLDGTGEASVFYPYGGSGSAPLAAGSSDFLAGSVVLDDAPGPEWIIALFSPRPLEAETFLAQLRAQQGSSSVHLSCDDCRVSTLRIQKQP